MIAAFESGETVIDVSELMLDTDNSELRTYISQFLNENPQYFYVRYVYKNEKMRDDNGYYTKIKSMKVWYNADYMDSDGKLDMQRIREKKAEVENGIKNALTAVSSDMSDIEKALALHDWVVRECDYDFENYENNTIPAEVLFVCRRLCQRTGSMSGICGGDVCSVSEGGYRKLCCNKQQHESCVEYSPFRRGVLSY